MAILAHRTNGTIQVYDRLAPVYDQLCQRWLQLSGGEAQAAPETTVRVEMTPGSKHPLCGLLRLTFCAEKSPRGLLEWMMQKRLVSRGTGRFLNSDWIGARVRDAMSWEVRTLPSAGPATTLIARRSLP